MSINPSPAFKENLAQLPPCDDVAKITLSKKEGGAEAGVIENKPGTGGSVKVYQYLLGLYGGEITRQAAYLGCALYGEHTDDAHKNPGNHGNIDRLMEVIKSGETLVGKVEKA
mmetsp:Transcript_7370/g.18397  ORF Transcript_7370/g.18397 Transcript_7370/m.18397 type:complete len:113 (+) Transcript_7370:128-466(+)|eukprot:CAMPEP_0206240508 /NCGR_PEP_ID=MMETSP0047_2-20121206/15976_1 /ASSEMBLY_ACC=CAM_ASM_000192 /TAXON_ID=195065 /ORGANISM="Chroomonas mesostigmatica_cf, Strain CCMP1168" /LENGTH=112 /DNA_ID=CAMNT_0053665295 /DNA_START=128 /DNA_END=466 /DNA_ORIENTATION=-